MPRLCAGVKAKNARPPTVSPTTHSPPLLPLLPHDFCRDEALLYALAHRQRRLRLHRDGVSRANARTGVVLHHFRCDGVAVDGVMSTASSRPWTSRCLRRVAPRARLCARPCAPSRGLRLPQHLQGCSGGLTAAQMLQLLATKANTGSLAISTTPVTKWATAVCTRSPAKNVRPNATHCGTPDTLH